MDKFKSFLLKALYPNPLVFVLSIVFSVPSLILIFVTDFSERFFAPPIYALSFYVLCIFVARLIPTAKKLKVTLKSNKYSSRYLSDADFRARLSLYSSTAINLIFAVFKFITGITYNSGWFMQIGVYYGILSIIRFILIYKNHKSENLTQGRLVHDWKAHRLCGYLLFTLNLTISAMTFRMIWHNRGFSYPGFVIYASAAYTFYRLIITIIKLVKASENKPVLSAAKSLDLSISLMAVFSLQTAMFASFGATTSDIDRLIMNSFTGFAVCLTVLVIAVLMIIKSNKQIKKLLRRDNNEHR